MNVPGRGLCYLVSQIGHPQGHDRDDENFGVVCMAIQQWDIAKDGKIITIGRGARAFTSPTKIIEGVSSQF